MRQSSDSSCTAARFISSDAQPPTHRRSWSSCQYHKTLALCTDSISTHLNRGAPTRRSLPSKLVIASVCPWAICATRVVLRLLCILHIVIALRAGLVLRIVSEFSSHGGIFDICESEVGRVVVALLSGKISVRAIAVEVMNLYAGWWCCIFSLRKKRA